MGNLRANPVPTAALMSDCVFCEIVAGNSPATIVCSYPDTIIIVPLLPVVEGHLLAIPKTHVKDALTSPLITGLTMMDAAVWADGPCNLITSVGKEATQSVFHLHIHIVPRAKNDGLALPWYSGKSKPTS